MIHMKVFIVAQNEKTINYLGFHTKNYAKFIKHKDQISED